MHIEVRVKDLELSLKERELIERRVQTALGRHGRHIANVRVMLRDINGPRGGADKKCSLQITGLRSWSVNLTELGDDPLVAVDKVVDRAVISVERAISRARTIKHKFEDLHQSQIHDWQFEAV